MKDKHMQDVPAYDVHHTCIYYYVTHFEAHCYITLGNKLITIDLLITI